MVQFEFTVQDPMGLHARPAGQMVKKAAEFQSKITIKKGAKAADARRLFSVMGLAVKQHETIAVEVEGSDEEQAAKAIETFLKENF